MVEEMSGQHVPSAWQPIVAEALVRLSALGAHVVEYGVDHGGLVVRLHHTTTDEVRQAASRIIDKAAAMCDAVCYDCGAPATARRRVFSVCDTHTRPT